MREFILNMLEYQIIYTKKILETVKWSVGWTFDGVSREGQGEHPPTLHLLDRSR